MMKVYKGTDKNLQCRGYQFMPGKTEEIDGNIKLCERGFHACESPLDVFFYYPPTEGRYFEAELDGVTDEHGDDSKRVGRKITLGAEIGIPGLVKAHVEYTREKAAKGTAGGDESNLAGGDESNLAGGDWSNLAGGDWSNLAGGDWSNLAGGDRSNLAGGDRSNLAGGNRSNLAGGDRSNLAGGNRSNLAGGNRSNLAGGDRSNLAGGDRSNLAGGDSSIIICRTGGKARAGLNSVIVLTEWAFNQNNNYIPICVQAIIIDGTTYKPDVWYTLQNGEVIDAGGTKQ